MTGKVFDLGFEDFGGTGPAVDESNDRSWFWAGIVVENFVGVEVEEWHL